MYGRARRLDLVKKIAIGLIILIVGFLIIKIILTVIPSKDNNVDFAYLRRYMVDLGYTCEPLKNAGSSCKYFNGDITGRFTRFEDGFEYIYNNKKYVIDLYHAAGEEKFTFSTGDGAFEGYRNLNYECKYKDSIIGELDKCVLVDDVHVKLDNEVYISYINKTMKDVKKMIKASGYKEEDLINDYKWNKK